MLNIDIAFYKYVISNNCKNDLFFKLDKYYHLERKLDPFFITYTTLNFGWIKDIKLKLQKY